MNLGSIAGDILVGFLFPPVVGWFWPRVLGRWLRLTFLSTWMWAAAGGCMGSVLPPANWGTAACDAASLLVALAIWWWRRKDRKRAASLIGEKTRALRDALVRRAREAAKPRPVLRPQPGGVR